MPRSPRALLVCAAVANGILVCSSAAFAGAITGRVTNAATDAPIAGAEVIFIPTVSGTGARVATDFTGRYTTPFLAPGSYLAWTQNSLGFVDERYGGVPCFLIALGCTSRPGPRIEVTFNGTTENIDFALELGGAISGTVRPEGSDGSFGLANVEIFTAQRTQVANATSNSSGSYQSTPLPPGIYYARTRNSRAGYIEEMFDNRDCVGQCDVTLGTPIRVVAGAVTPAHFALRIGGAISGRVTVEGSGAGIDWSVNLFDASGTRLDTAFASSTSSSAGSYQFSRLPAGVYFAATSGAWRVETTNMVDELYADVPCAADSCLKTRGTPIRVTLGATTQNVNFSLIEGGHLAGVVRDAASGKGLANATVALFTSNGIQIANLKTNATGEYGVTESGLPPGIYFARTVNSVGYVDELYSEIRCPLTCDVRRGAPIAINVGATTVVDFALDPAPRPPPPPQLLAASTRGDFIDVMWAATAGGAPGSTAAATGYRVEVGTASGAVDGGAVTVGLTTTATVGPLPVQRYLVRVRAVSDVGVSDPSNEAVVRVGSVEAWMAPRNFRAVVNGRSAQLQWDAPLDISEVLGYIVEAGVAPGSISFMSPAMSERAVTLPSVPDGTFYVRVASVVSSGRRAVSNEVTITVGERTPCTTAPGPVSTLRGAVSVGEVHLNWSAPATGSPPAQYVIQVGSTSGAANLAVFMTDARSTTLSARAPAGTYFVRVFGVNACGTGTASNEVSVVVPAASP